MNTHDELDELITQRLRATAPNDAPDRLLDGAMSRIAETPQRGRGSFGWFGSPAGRLLAAAAVVVLAVVAGAQVSGLIGRPVGTDVSPSPSATTTETAPPSTSTASSAAPSASAPAPQETEPALAGDEALLSLITSCEILPPVVGPTTTVLADGRIIWPRATSADPAPVLSVRRLSERGLATVRDEIVGSGLFEADAAYRPEPLPGAEPPGHGACQYDYFWRGGEEPVHVSSTMWFGDDEESTYYEPAPEREALDALAQRLTDPEAWLDASDWAEAEAVAFQPESYLITAVVHEGGTEGATLGAPDIDAVAWPFPEPPDTFGNAVSNGRCDVASADAIDRFAGDLAAAGMEQFEQPVDGPTITLPWAEGDASVELVVYPQRPDGEPPCGGSLGAGD
jgi:hypothetical protein